MKVNEALLPIKAAFLFHSAVFGCLLPFKTLFQMQLGMTYSQNGIIQAVERLTRTCLPPVVTVVADKFTIHKIIMIAFILLAICASVPMYFLPPVSVMDQHLDCVSMNEKVFCYGQDEIMHLCTSQDNSSMWNCYNSTLNQNFDMFCYPVEKTVSDIKNVNFSTCLLEKTPDQTLDYGSYQTTFILLIVLTIFQSMFLNTLQPLIDGSAMNVLGPDKIGDYGKQRLFGSIGFGFSGLLAGILIDLYTQATGQVETDYAVIFIGISLFCLLTAISLYFLNVPKQNAPSLSKSIKKIFKNKHVPVFLLMSLVGGFVIGVRFTFGFLYISTLPGSSQTIFGLSILIRCASEIPMFFMSGWMIRKIGCPACLSIGLISDAFRVFCYTVLTSAWQLLLVDPLNSLSFALFFSAMNTYATLLAPKGMNSTIISVTHATYWGIGFIVGNLYGGFVSESHGEIVMFRITAAIGWVSAILYYVIHKCLVHFCTNEKENLEKKKPQTTNNNIINEENNLLTKVENTSI